MKSRYTSKILALTLALAILFSLASCFNIMPPTPSPDGGEIENTELGKELLLKRVDETLENDTYKHSYVYQYLSRWGLVDFDTYKFYQYEYIFSEYYNFGDGLPDTLTHSADTVKYFVENFYDTVDFESEEKLTDALLKSYVSTVGDKYAFYRTAEEFEDFETEMSGVFGGIGVLIEYDHTEGTLLVSQVYEGPAKEGGMKVGDYIVGVDGKTFEEMGGYQNVIYFVRGEVGTDVTVTVDRDGQLIDITMTRALVENKSVTYELTDEGYGYIAISQFVDNTAEQFKEAVEDLEDLGAVGYIFDVRTNGGGYVHSVVEILSYILPSNKVIISYQYKGDARRYYYTGEDKVPTDEDPDGRADHVIDLPIVVLCDEYTASAGEIFVACLRDYDGPVSDIIDVTIVGATTFGKGVMQGSISYTPDDSYVTLTVSYYNPPSGVNYHGIGITPDIIVELGETEDTQYAEAIKQMELLLKSQQ